MPDAISYLRIVPTSVLDDWKAATASPLDPDGLGATLNVYTLSDGLPRSITHKAENGRAKDDQVPIVDAAGYDANGYLIAVNLDPSFSGVLCKKRNHTQGQPLINFQAVLAENGLTTDPGA